MFPLYKEETVYPEESFSPSSTKKTAQIRKRKRRKPMRQPTGGSDFFSHPSPLRTGCPITDFI